MKTTNYYEYYDNFKCCVVTTLCLNEYYDSCFSNPLRRNIGNCAI